MNCQFCLTALLGVQRNLAPGEIVGQILAVLRDHSIDLKRERINIVFMGMGEPFLNYDNFIKAVRLLVDEVGFPESRITVSTSGIVPRIIDFGREPIRPKLAISLNAPNDEIRTAAARTHNFRVRIAEWSERCTRARPRSCTPRA